MSSPEHIICGGLAPESTEIDPKVHEFCERFRPQIEEKFGKKFDHLKAVKVRTQVVSGVNYYIKCDVGNNQYVHIRVYEPLPRSEKETELTAVHPEMKTLEDPLEYFQ